MKVEDLFGMKLEDVLNEFCMLYSPECDEYYGITYWDDALAVMEDLDKKHDDISEFVTCEPLIPFDFFCIDEDTEIKDEDRLREIFNYLGQL